MAEMKEFGPVAVVGGDAYYLTSEGRGVHFMSRRLVGATGGLELEGVIGEDPLHIITGRLPIEPEENADFIRALRLARDEAEITGSTDDRETLRLAQDAATTRAGQDLYEAEPQLRQTLLELGIF